MVASTGARFVRFWVDGVPLSDVTENHDDRGRDNVPVVTRNASRTLATPERRKEGSSIPRTTEEDRARESPDFGGGVDYHDYDDQRRERILIGGSSSTWREHIPSNERMTPPKRRITPELFQKIRTQICSLHSKEPLRDCFRHSHQEQRVPKLNAADG